MDGWRGTRLRCVTVINKGGSLDSKFGMENERLEGA